MGGPLVVRIIPISVIIPVRNEGDRIVRAVESILSGRSCCFPIELVVIDDASTDRCCDRLPELVERLPRPGSCCGALARWSVFPKRAIASQKRRETRFMSSPMQIRDFCRIRSLPIWCHFCPGRVFAATIVDMQSAFGGFGCQLLLPSMSAAWLPAPGIYGGHVPVAACTGTVIDRSLLHHLRGYDEALPLYGAAEPEFSVRVWLSGYDVVNLPDLLIAHRFRPRPDLTAFLQSIGRFTAATCRFACYYPCLRKC